MHLKNCGGKPSRRRVRSNPARISCPLLLLVFLVAASGVCLGEEAARIRVRRGDTISYLAFKTYGLYDPRMLRILQQENPEVKDVALIYAGQQLRFPSREAMARRLAGKPARPPEPVKTEPWEEKAPQEEPAAGTRVRAYKGVMTFLQGEVQVKKAGDAGWSSARANMILSAGDQVKVLARSRAELILDNQSVLRLAEKTVLTIQKLEEDAATRKETARMELSLGRLWTRAAKLFNPASRYDVNTPMAIAGVHGTVYQVSVAPDKTTNVQVFQGAVDVYNPFPQGRGPAAGQAGRAGLPQEVSGPREVPGPTAVSREEWTRILVGQRQQVSISELGASRPQPLDVNKERQDEWVRWNEERDADFQPPANR